MAEPLAVDANCLLSAMLGGRAREIIFSTKFELFSPQVTLFEVSRHISWLAARLGKTELHLYDEFQLLPVFACQPSTYAHQLELATQLIGQRDPLDIPLLALALARGYPLWSDDRDFEDIAEIKLRTTGELLSELARP